MGRLQVQMGAVRIRRRAGTVRAVGAYLAARHCPVQQVSPTDRQIKKKRIRSLRSSESADC